MNFGDLNHFQKIVLSLISGLNSTKDQLQSLQKEFIRLDVDNSGTLCLDELRKLDNFANWESILQQCDQNGDGVIDFQEFISAALDRKVLI